MLKIIIHAFTYRLLRLLIIYPTTTTRLTKATEPDMEMDIINVVLPRSSEPLVTSQNVPFQLFPHL